MSVLDRVQFSFKGNRLTLEKVVSAAQGTVREVLKGTVSLDEKKMYVNVFKTDQSFSCAVLLLISFQYLIVEIFQYNFRKKLFLKIPSLSLAGFPSVRLSLDCTLSN